MVPRGHTEARALQRGGPTRGRGCGPRPQSLRTKRAVTSLAGGDVKSRSGPLTSGGVAGPGHGPAPRCVGRKPDGREPGDVPAALRAFPRSVPLPHPAGSPPAALPARRGGPALPTRGTARVGGQLQRWAEGVARRGEPAGVPTRSRRAQPGRVVCRSREEASGAVRVHRQSGCTSGQVAQLAGSVYLFAFTGSSNTRRSPPLILLCLFPPASSCVGSTPHPTGGGC